jgi:hypothetical protein
MMPEPGWRNLGLRTAFHCLHFPGSGASTIEDILRGRPRATLLSDRACDRPQGVRYCQMTLNVQRGLETQNSPDSKWMWNCFLWSCITCTRGESVGRFHFFGWFMTDHSFFAKTNANFRKLCSMFFISSCLPQRYLEPISAQGRFYQLVQMIFKGKDNSDNSLSPQREIISGNCGFAWVLAPIEWLSGSKPCRDLQSSATWAVLLNEIAPSTAGNGTKHERGDIWRHDWSTED